MKFSRFEPLLQQGSLGAVNVTSFRCRVYLESAGPNWLIAGEAASLVDPMTSNGVTAALRHAAEAAALVLKFRTRGELPLRARKAYSSRIVQTAKFFNEGIEKVIYEPVDGHERRHELGADRGLQEGLLIGQQGIHGGVAAVERVGREVAPGSRPTRSRGTGD